MAEESSNLRCPNCRKMTVLKPGVYYRVFEKLRQPDGVCNNCGTFCWKYSQKPIPPVAFKPVERKEDWNWYKEFLKKEEKKQRSRN